MKIHVVLAATLLAAATVPRAIALPYLLDAADSEVLIRTDRAGLLRFAGHRHVIRARELGGTVHWNPAAGTLDSLEVRIEAASLQVMDPKLDPEDVAQVQREMEDNVLEVLRFPEIVFTCSSVRATENGTEAVGRLDLHGVSRELVIPLSITRWKDRIRLAAEFEVRQSDHGIRPPTVGLGAVRVADVLRIEIRAEGRQPQPDGEDGP